MLTQKASPADVSLNEYIIGYLLHEGKINEAQLRTFKPSVCNRLDRNTSGLVLAGKSMKGSRELSEIIKNRTLENTTSPWLREKSLMTAVYVPFL